MRIAHGACLTADVHFGRMRTPQVRSRCRSDLVLVGVFGAPHGVRGEVRLKSYTEDPLAIAAYGPLQRRDGQRHFVLEAARGRVKDDMLVARVDGRERPRGRRSADPRRALISRAKLPPPEERTNSTMPT